MILTCTMQSHVLLLTIMVLFTFTLLTQAQSGDRQYLEKCGETINNGSFKDIIEWSRKLLSGNMPLQEPNAQTRNNHTQIPVWVCEALCAGKRGWIFYPPSDIVSRFWMWMLPLFVLLANIHFAPLGWLNALCVTAHVLGDPIDFMGSLNTRLEVGSRLYKYWKQSNLNCKHFDERARPLDIGDGNDNIQQLADSHSFPGHVHGQQDISQIPNTKHPMAFVSQYSLRSACTFTHDCTCGSQYHNDHHKTVANSGVFAFSAVDLATICMAYDDLGQFPPSQQISDQLRLFLRSASPRQTLLAKKAIIEAAIDLSEAWTDLSFRTAAAVASYVIAVVVSYYKLIDPWVEDTITKYNNRTSHSIAFAISYSWLISVVILSAATGGFSNQHSVEKVLSRLKGKIPELGPPVREPGTAKTRIQVGATGMNYGYRPAKALGLQDPTLSMRTTDGESVIGPDNENNHRCQPLLAQFGWKLHYRKWIVIIPLVASTLCAFLISWYTPTEGFGCRSLHQLCLLLLFILSHAMTVLIQRFIHGRIRAYQYPCIIIKDTLVAATHITFLCLAFIGFYNRCFCWAAWFSRGPDKAVVTLDIKEYFEHKLSSLWPVLIFGAIIVQFLFSAMLIWNKPRCMIFKRTAKEQRESAEKLQVYESQLLGDFSACNK